MNLDWAVTRWFKLFPGDFQHRRHRKDSTGEHEDDVTDASSVGVIPGPGDSIRSPTSSGISTTSGSSGSSGSQGSDGTGCSNRDRIGRANRGGGGGEPVSKPVLRKHGKLISFFRSFILNRPNRGKLKKSGILKERVFGCDLSEHLLNTGQPGKTILSFIILYNNSFKEITCLPSEKPFFPK